MVVQFGLKILDRLAKVLCCVVIVMEMDLHFAVASAAQSREQIEVVGHVLLCRIKKRVLRRVPVGIVKPIRHPRIVFEPMLDALQPLVPRGLVPQGFVMVHNAEKNVCRHDKWRRPTLEIAWQPQMDVFQHRHDSPSTNGRFHNSRNSRSNNTGPRS